ncbi:uncharacterized protein N7515_004407 [Penicillium bovifimosum]|uniref:Uncharacterized protein n=1 Tax=Penicillium bovifimosum TaxID=126998 RepID=A0A9W9H022_9EURO|nr:uncharacterized protein N7515_004407 [Penicillium bovifimosum]KAJ5135129.1 hypothetical protein N7515_004407 [Penicillium bovifimosum]
MASTPPPPSPSALRVPRAPRHGPKHDNYEPYATRYSARLASQRASRADKITPPPNHPSTSAKTGTSKRTLSPSSPDAAIPSPKKTTRSHTIAASRISHPELEHALPRSPQHTSRSSAERALPTPAKTPSKKKVATSASSTSRSLFPPTSTPKRRKMDATNHSITPLDIFSDESVQAATQGSIPIHEDSRDRIPGPPGLVNDIFIGRARPVRRPATRSAAGNSRDDGAWFVHRGKKIFKRFDDTEDQDDDEDDLGLFASRPDLLARNPDILKSVKPLKRADVKPRVLFPAAGDTAHEEEDVTDVEDCEPMSPTPASFPSTVHSAPELESSLQFGASPFTTTRDFSPASATNVPAINLQEPEGGPLIPASGEEPGPQAEALGQTSFRDSPGSSLLKYWPVSTKRRDVQARADRAKRPLEAPSTPVPRTRKAHAAAAAEAAASHAPAPGASTSDA